MNRRLPGEPVRRRNESKAAGLTQVSVCLTDDLLAVVSEYAEERCITRSRAISEIIQDRFAVDLALRYKIKLEEIRSLRDE